MKKGTTKGKNRIGERNINIEGYEMIIIEYNNYQNVIVEFQDKYKGKKKCQYGHFQNGQVTNPYHKTTYGIGYLGIGKYNFKNYFEIYKCWKSMLKRCYSNHYSTYEDCIVDEYFHNFQNFAQWYEENYYIVKDEEMCLDKDILLKGNKIYSPNTCIFVPKRINVLFVKCDKSRGEYPIGMHLDKKINKIIVQCSIYGKQIILGKFLPNQIEQAFQIYKNFKEKHIKQVADEYKDLIPKELYEAMYRYEVEIND